MHLLGQLRSGFESGIRSKGGFSIQRTVITVALHGWPAVAQTPQERGLAMNHPEYEG